MNSFYEYHKHNIQWHYRCFDRILLNGLIQPFQQPERVVGFFNTYRQLYPGASSWLDFSEPAATAARLLSRIARSAATGRADGSPNEKRGSYCLARTSNLSGRSVSTTCKLTTRGEIVQAAGSSSHPPSRAECDGLAKATGYERSALPCWSGTSRISTRTRLGRQCHPSRRSSPIFTRQIHI
jgi:hypothetical protein